MDRSLDDIVAQGKKRGRGGGVFRVGKPWIQGKPPGMVSLQRTRPVSERLGLGKPAAAKSVKPGGDLRDILASKQKKQVVDLRTKIKPKSSPMGRGRGRLHPALQGGRMSGPVGAPKQARSRSPIRKPYAPLSSPTSHTPNGRRHRTSPIRLPSSTETKKITVTVPGFNRPAPEHSQGMYRREEHLAVAIQRSKEARHESYMRGREEVLAQAITSALGGGGGGGGGGMERDHGIGAGYPRMQMRYNRSPSPGLDPSLSGYGTQHHAPPPPPPPPLSRSKGITTMTTMTISNLSDTVSKNDIAELCGAVGSLETVSMVAPGVAEVVFKYKDDALEAYKKYNQRNLDGQPMICKLQATSRGRAMHTGGGGGYGGGMRSGFMDSYGGDFNSYTSSFY